MVGWIGTRAMLQKNGHGQEFGPASINCDTLRPQIILRFSYFLEPQQYKVPHARKDSGHGRGRIL